MSSGEESFGSVLMPKERILGLFKFGRRDHMEEFVHAGHLYMNTLSYFASLEAEIPRQDRDDGAAFCMQPDRTKLSVELDGEFREIPGLVGPILYWEDADRNSNVFCMYAFRASQASALIDPRNFEFGDAYVLLTNGDEFLRRVKLAAQESGKRLRWGLVTYVDRATHHGAMGIFKKFSDFSYQSEFRIALSSGAGSPYSLRIGDLSDIAVVGKLAALNNSLRVVDEQ
jgi:hypothetical protein